MARKKLKTGDRTILVSDDGERTPGVVIEIYDEPTIVVRTDSGKLWVASQRKGYEGAQCLKAKKLGD